MSQHESDWISISRVRVVCSHVADHGDTGAPLSRVTLRPGPGVRLLAAESPTDDALDVIVQIDPTAIAVPTGQRSS